MSLAEQVRANAGRDSKLPDYLHELVRQRNTELEAKLARYEKALKKIEDADVGEIEYENPFDGEEALQLIARNALEGRDE